jgi:diguanylate cyclase (GGDEF)-like protein
MTREDGSLFGTLCAIHPTLVPDTVIDEQPLVELLGRLLSSVLASDLRAADATRRADRALADAETDGLTGLMNRRGWDRVLAAEEAQCRKFGHPACIITIDLDGLKAANDTLGHSAGDALIRRAGDALRAVVRSSDVAARVGGDEFVVLAAETDQDASVGLVHRIKATLIASGVSASVGVAPREPDRGLLAAWTDADQGMYAHKRKRKGSASLPTAVP